VFRIMVSRCGIKRGVPGLHSAFRIFCDSVYRKSKRGMTEIPYDEKYLFRFFD
jgi:hypothetical protein